MQEKKKSEKEVVERERGCWMERRNGDVVPSWDTRRLPVDERGPASFRVALIIIKGGNYILAFTA